MPKPERVRESSYRGSLERGSVYMAELGEAEYAPDRSIDNRAKLLKDKASVGNEHAFPHPCIVMFVHNDRLALVVPCTSKVVDKPFQTMCVDLPEGSYSNSSEYGSALCYQLRTIDRNRISTHIGRLDQKVFENIRGTIKNLMQNPRSK